MFNTGKLVILAMGLMAVAGVAISFWYHQQNSKQILAYLGPETASLVARADGVELLVLDVVDLPANDLPAEKNAILPIDGEPHAIVARYDLSQTPGLIHARTALLEDANYDWQTSDASCAPAWTYALKFTHQDQSTTLLISLDCPRLRVSGREQSVTLGRLAEALDSFFAEQQSSEPGRR